MPARAGSHTGLPLPASEGWLLGRSRPGDWPYGRYWTTCCRLLPHGETSSHCSSVEIQTQLMAFMCCEQVRPGWVSTQNWRRIHLLNSVAYVNDHAAIRVTLPLLVLLNRVWIACSSVGLQQLPGFRLRAGAAVHASACRSRYRLIAVIHRHSPMTSDAPLRTSVMASNNCMTRTGRHRWT